MQEQAVPVLAKCWQCWHNAGMTVKITIRNVSEEVRDKLALRAARNRQSMQEYLLSELERVAALPSNEELMERVRQRVEASGTRISAADILAARDADRK